MNFYWFSTGRKESLLPTLRVHRSDTSSQSTVLKINANYCNHGAVYQVSSEKKYRRSSSAAAEKRPGRLTPNDCGTSTNQISSNAVRDYCVYLFHSHCTMFLTTCENGKAILHYTLITISVVDWPGATKQQCRYPAPTFSACRT